MCHARLMHDVSTSHTISNDPFTITFIVHVENEYPEFELLHLPGREMIFRMDARREEVLWPSGNSTTPVHAWARLGMIPLALRFTTGALVLVDGWGAMALQFPNPSYG